jgi:hypothetical protein
MRGQAKTRLIWGALIATGVLGCSISTPPSDPAPNTPGDTHVAKTTVYPYRLANAGKIVGKVVATSAQLSAVSATDFTGAKAQAFDPDGTPLTDQVDLDSAGNFTLSGLKESRPRIFIEADVKGLRFRASTEAPRDDQVYNVSLDAATTYLADKLRRAALDKNVPLDKLNELTVVQTAQVVNVYLKAPDGLKIIESTDADLNAYSFDNFMEDNLPVKMAVYALSPAITRGWTPPPPSPTPTPSFSPSPSPSPSPSESPSEPPVK